MKLKRDFITEPIGDKVVLVAVGDASRAFNGMVRGNKTTAFLLEKLRTETTEDALTEALLQEYEVSGEQAKASVRKVLETLRSVGALEE